MIKYCIEKWDKNKDLLRRTLEKYPTCDECDIRHTCAKVGNKSGLYICEMLKEIEKELNIK